MAKIRVGSARIDENGTAGWDGKAVAGDQTGKEVCEQNFYVHSKGWNILRPKSVDHANAIASNMIKACNNDNIGYDQSNRLGVVKNGIDTDTPTESDCSSLVREVIKESTGVDVGNFTTGNEASVLEKSGLFEERVAYVSQTKTPVYNGDVLVTKTKGHTVVVTSGNPRKTAPVITPTKELGFKVGDTVAFKGCLHYSNATKSGVARACKAGLAKVTKVSAGKPHPYHLKAVAGKGATVYGWVNEADIAGENSGKTHKVVSGETLSKIAKKYDTTVEALIALNGIKNKNLIRVGQVISLP